MGQPGLQQQPQPVQQLPAPSQRTAIALPPRDYTGDNRLTNYASVARDSFLSRAEDLRDRIYAEPSTSPKAREHADTVLKLARGDFKSWIDQYVQLQVQTALPLEDGLRDAEQHIRDLETFLPKDKLPDGMGIDERFRVYVEKKGRENTIAFQKSANGGYFVDLPENWSISVAGVGSSEIDISGGRKRHYLPDLAPGTTVNIKCDKENPFNLSLKLAGQNGETLRTTTTIEKLAPSKSTSGAAGPPRPQVAEPRTPQVEDLRTPQVAEPRTPQAAEPRTPQAAEPRTPQAANPRTPQVADPDPADAQPAETNPQKLKATAQAVALPVVQAESKPSALYRADELHIPADVIARNNVVQPFVMGEGTSQSYLFPRRYTDKETVPHQEVAGFLMVRDRDLTPSVASLSDPHRAAITQAYAALKAGKVKIDKFEDFKDSKEQFSLRTDGSVVYRVNAAAETATILRPIFEKEGARSVLKWDGVEAKKHAADERYYPPGKAPQPEAAKPVAPAPPAAAQPAQSSSKIFEEARRFVHQLSVDGKPTGLHVDTALAISDDPKIRMETVVPFGGTENGLTAYAFPRRFKLGKETVSGVLFVRNADLLESTEKAEASMRDAIREAYRGLLPGAAKPVKIEDWRQLGGSGTSQFCLRSDGSVLLRSKEGALEAVIFRPVMKTEGDKSVLTWDSVKAKRPEGDVKGRYEPEKNPPK